MIKDKMWLWGHEPGTHDGHYNLPSSSRMTPVEAALYLGVENVLMIGIGNVPAPPFDQHMIALRAMKRVVWSVVGDSSSDRVDLEEIVRLAAKFPNLCAAIMDDFFHEPDERGAIARVSVDELKCFRARLQSAARPLELWATLYAHDLHLPVQNHLAQCDALTFWTWTADKLENLEDAWAKLEHLAPSQKKLLGCYLWDYGAGTPMPLDAMRHQCEFGLKLLRAGRADGMIFLSNSACDHDLENVEWTRDWIARVGDENLN